MGRSRGQSKRISAATETPSFDLDVTPRSARNERDHSPPGQVNAHGKRDIASTAVTTDSANLLIITYSQQTEDIARDGLIAMGRTLQPFLGQVQRYFP